MTKDEKKKDPQDDAQSSDSSLDAKVLEAELEALKIENEALRKQVEEGSPQALKDMAARAQADLQNAKERLHREAQDLRKFAIQSMLEKLLPVVDNFQRAFTHLPEELRDHDWVKGVQAVEQDFVRILAESGLAKIDAVGQAIDPVKHEVLQAGPGEKDTVIEVFEEGYVLNDKVLRPAKVKAGDGSDS